MGPGILGEIIEDVAEIDIGGISQGNNAGEADIMQDRPVEHRGTQRPGL